MSNVKSPWIAFHQPRVDARLRLFCFPFAGGGASNFRTWAQELPDWIEPVPIQYPGREQRFSEPLVDRLEPLVQGIEEAILPLCDRPFAFYGHSMGSLVCFEAARSLHKTHGLSPERLFVASRQAPSVGTPEERRIHRLPDDAFLASVQTYGGIPAQVLQEPELRQMAINLLRADFTVLETFQYLGEGPLACPIIAYGGETDPIGDEEILSTWQPLTSAAFSYRQMPGGHFFLNTHRSVLLSDLVQELGSTVTRPTASL